MKNKMERFINSIIKFRWAIALLIPLLTITMASQLKHLEFEGSYRIWFGEDSSILKDYDDFRVIFGNDDAVTIFFKDDRTEMGVFNKEALSSISRITEALWKTKYITRVDSLTNFQHVHTDAEYPDEVIVENLFYEIDSLSDAQLKAKKEIALNEDLVRGRMISEDATTTMIVARLTPKAGDDPVVPMVLPDLVRDILNVEKDKNDFNFYLNGGPIINEAFIKIAQSDGGTFTPLVIIVAMFLLALIFKRPSAVLLSISVVIFTFLIVLSIQVMLGYKMNNFTANIPVFIVAIGIADAMHLFWIYTLGRKKGMQNHEAIHYSVSKNFLPVFLTSLTTAIGFASLGISEVVPIKTLGIATANGAVLAFIMTILFVPAVLAIVNPKIKPAQEDVKTASDKFATWYGAWVVKHDVKILVVSLIVFTALGLGIIQVRVDSNTVRYFKEDVPYRVSTQFLQDNLSGPMSYEVVVDSKTKDGIKDPAFLKTVEKFYGDFYEKYPDVRHISSLLDVVKQFNKVLDDKDSVPESQELVAQYLLLYSLSLPQGMEINDKMDIEERLLRVSAMINIVDTSLDLEMITWAETWWNDTPYSAKVNGQTSMFAHMQKDVTATLIESITLAMVAISIMMLLIFKNLKMLPIFIIPNILPIALVVGVMGWIGVDIDMGVAIAGAIILGVAVDDTIHFLVKYLEARKQGQNVQEALTYVMHYAGSAIIFTTIILSSAFLVFMFSDFNPNYYFGIVTATALVVAMVVDLLMLPALFSIIDSKKKSELVN
jgi:hydrophobe/amphiphile efflux-3 (HAE3) family protein